MTNSDRYRGIIFLYRFIQLSTTDMLIWHSLTLAVQPLPRGSSLIFGLKSVNAPLIPRRKTFYPQYSCNDLP